MLARARWEPLFIEMEGQNFDFGNFPKGRQATDRHPRGLKRVQTEQGVTVIDNPPAAPVPSGVKNRDFATYNHLLIFLPLYRGGKINKDTEYCPRR